MQYLICSVEVDDQTLYKINFVFQFSVVFEIVFYSKSVGNTQQHYFISIFQWEQRGIDDWPNTKTVQREHQQTHDIYIYTHVYIKCLFNKYII